MRQDIVKGITAVNVKQPSFSLSIFPNGIMTPHDSDHECPGSWQLTCIKPPEEQNRQGMYVTHVR